MGKKRVGGEFKAAIYPTQSNPPASFLPPQHAKSSVGVCLSGGGSRSFVAGIGQLQALEAVQVNGDSLLSQVSVLVTVSGGGWIGIPFTYLPSKFSDTEFLGVYTPPNALTLPSITANPPGIGNQITSGFSAIVIALSLIVLRYWHRVPWNMTWQTVMGMTFLRPYGLYSPGWEKEPTELFSYDQTSLVSGVTKPNPELAKETASLVAQVQGQRRPYHVGMMGMSVNISTTSNPILAPVHSTPFVTGIFSTPPGALDSANKRPVGGGVVTSFAFNSVPVSVTAATAKLTQTRQWSLTDVLGTSSAFYAGTLMQLQFIEERFEAWRHSLPEFLRDIKKYKNEVASKMSLNDKDASDLSRWLRSLEANKDDGDVSVLTADKIRLGIPDLAKLDPCYGYWSVANPPLANQHVRPNYFTDGGNLDDTGVAALLSYANIEKVITFLNVSNPILRSGNNIKVDPCLPALFGYQKFENGGYAPYTTAHKNDDLQQFNQVFPSANFQELLDGLWAASGSGKETGAAVFTQHLTTVANEWFGVPGGKKVTVVWVYLNYASDWLNQLTDAGVKKALADAKTERKFPNYPTIDTQLTPCEVNLLSNFTSWVVQGSGAKSQFTVLFPKSRRKRTTAAKEVSRATSPVKPRKR